MRYINNYFFLSLICITFYRRKSNVTNVKIRFDSEPAQNCTQSPCDRAHHCNTLVRIYGMDAKNALNCMRKQKTCWVVVKVARLC